MDIKSKMKNCQLISIIYYNITSLHDSPPNIVLLQVYNASVRPKGCIKYDLQVR